MTLTFHPDVKNAWLGKNLRNTMAHDNIGKSLGVKQHFKLVQK